MDAETYPGEALDSAMMLARLDYPETQIAASIAQHFPQTEAEAAAQLAHDAVIAAAAERAEDPHEHGG